MSTGKKGRSASEDEDVDKRLNASDDEGEDDDQQDNSDDEEEDESDSEDERIMDEIIGLKQKRPSSASASSSSKKAKHDSDDEVAPDEDAEPAFVSEDYGAMDASNIIPRSKRRAALRSGLTRASSSAPKRVAQSSSTLSDDEEAEF
mmetsp:Transcript_12470/g.18846  ORF Transcript_12470/g.18846 Transcript_12470/m.18846 type:complete len:147 (-) Transcript_12470:159-599(-)|eukprot:CAMPEP_0185022848 /NCGR_PEP_ID=MMETSP1103-20130426/5551_1 /TAXON_ID=36769 /ORGANISM="Paraphysomonas bandaiensis, Strain Caron Lab Isolate" /LENGTH=146 /DNA_ID=CAMNT_0027555115 /DNA_START=64 /DNA_END=504 /DNA_ORIENTATION=+